MVNAEIFECLTKWHEIAESVQRYQVRIFAIARTEIGLQPQTIREQASCKNHQLLQD